MLRIRAAVLLSALLLAGCASTPVTLSPGDCVTARLWSNGWHAAIALPADSLAQEHPFRMLFPEARYVLVGWGARDFYAADEAGFLDGVFAIVPPTASVLHVIAGEEPVEETLWRPRETVDFAMSKSAARAIADSFAESLVYDANGAPVIAGEGRVRGASYFLAAKGQFHLFNMCNHWTARRLSDGGLPLNAAVSFTAGGLLGAVRRKLPRECPAPETNF